MLPSCSGNPGSGSSIDTSSKLLSSYEMELLLSPAAAVVGAAVVVVVVVVAGAAVVVLRRRDLRPLRPLRPLRSFFCLRSWRAMSRVAN